VENFDYNLSTISVLSEISLVDYQDNIIKVVRSDEPRYKEGFVPKPKKIIEPPKPEPVVII
jgi:hypothetical protein